MDAVWLVYAVAGSLFVGDWSNADKLPGGDHGGIPTVVFDKAMKNAVVMSPASQFMAAALSVWEGMDKTNNVGFGLLGSVTKVRTLRLESLLLLLALVMHGVCRFLRTLSMRQYFHMELVSMMQWIYGEVGCATAMARTGVSETLISPSIMLGADTVFVIATYELCGEFVVSSMQVLD